MTNEQFEKLKRQCGGMLRANDLRLGTKTAAKTIHAFWYGALCALGEPDNPSVAIRLLSGRHDELVNMQGE